MKNLFYTTLINENWATFSEEESQHCVQVLRHKVGDLLKVTDGIGSFYDAEIVEAHKKKCVLSIKETQVIPPQPFQIHIAVAPTKNIERIEWFLEKATEIGINEISLIQCQRSERQVVRLDRLEKVLVSAMKQSVQAYKPTIHPIVKLSQFIEQSKQIQAQKFVAHLPSSKESSLKKNYSINNNVIVVIGPEGDFTTEEINLLHKANFESASLGQNRLRTETAALVACQTINLLNQL